MPNPWPDPFDDQPEPPRPVRDALVYFAATLIACFMLVNLIRGLAGEGWNW